jgi:hypothetical protein
MSNTLFRLKRSAVKGKAPNTSNIELGELALNTNDGRLFFKTVDSASTQSIVTIREISGGTGITETNGVVSITDTGVVSGQYGTSTTIPVLTVNAQGQITAMDSVAVAGVSQIAFDSASATLNISTADGGSFNARIGLSSFSTSDLSEGTNLYYTTARIDSDLLNLRTSIIPSQDSAVDLGDPTHRFRHLYLSGNSIYIDNVRLSVDSATGQLTVNNVSDSSPVKYDLQYNTTTDLAEGDNLYYTTARADSDARYAISVAGDRLSYNPSTGIITYSESKYVGFDSDFNQKTTDQLSEGTINQYYTDARARHAISALDNGGDGAFSYDSVTGTFSYTGPSASEVRAHFSAGTGITLTNGSIATTITQYTDADARGTITAGNSGTGYGALSYDSSTGQFTFTKVTSANIRGVLSASGDLSYNPGTGEFSVTTYKDSNARGALSAGNDGIGFGSLSYDNVTGAFTLTKVDSSEIRSVFSAGGDLSYDSVNGRFSFTERTDSEVRGLVSAVDKGGDGSFSYNPTTGEFSYTGPSATEVRAHFSANKGLTVTDGEFNIDSANVKGMFSVTDNGGDGSLGYADGVITYTGPSSAEVQTHFSAGTNTTYSSGTFDITDSVIRSKISVTDAGGDGSLSYNDSSGVLTYTGPSASEVRAHFSGGTGVTISDGEIAIAQSVGTTDDVQFGKVTVDSAQVACLHLNKLPEAPNSLRGLLYYDSDPQNGLSFIPTTNELVEDVTINLGQETLIYVHNLTGEQINNGDAVYVSGTAHGVHPQVTKAKADASSTASPIGIATMDIPNGNHGYVTKVGLVRGLNTSGMIEGAFAYLSADSAGKWSTNEVSIDQGYPTHVGRVISVDSQEGSLLVNIEKEHAEYLRVEDRMIVDGSVTMDSAVANQVSTNWIDFTPQDTIEHPTPSQVEGRVFYHDEYKALTVYNDITGSSLQVGHEEWIRVYNNSGSSIANGTPLYASGAQGEVMTVAPANASSEAASRVIGVATNDIANNSEGVATVRGLISGIDTSGLTAGQPVHLSPSGGFQNSAPTYPYFPVDLGGCVVSDASNGYIYIRIETHTFEQLRVTGNTHMDGNLTVDGDLTVNGTQSVVSQANLAVDNSFIYLNSGNTIGEENTNFTGSGLDDAYFTGHYEGTTTVTFYVRIDGVGTGTGGVDTFEWSLDNFSTTEATGVDITGANQELLDGVNIFFNATTGHTSGDKWDGQAAPTNVDTGWFTNRNTGATGVGYTHLGIYFDVSDGKFKAVDAYAPEPEGSIDEGDSSYSLGIFKAQTFEGNLTGNVTGNVTGNATSATVLATGRTIGLTGDITATGVSFNGGQNITLTTDIASGVITNAEISASAAIADTKLATISTSGKVQNSATTATSANTASTIVARDGSGNFTAGMITASLTGDVTGNATSADSATTAKNANYATGAGYATNAGYATYADSAGHSATAGYATNAGYVSYADSAGYATDAGYATNAGYASYADSAGYSTSAGYATNAGYVSYADSAGYATDAGYATNAGYSSYADSADVSASAGYATNAGYASFADSATNAEFADSATNASTLNKRDPSYYLNYNNFSNKPNITNSARAAISVTHASGDGSLSYNDSSGVITYTGPSASEVRAHFSAGSNIAITNGVISVTGSLYTDSDATHAISVTNSGTGYGSLSYNNATGQITYNKVTAANIRSSLSVSGDLTFDSATGQFSFSETYSTANELLTAIKTVDGTNSGLDADTLDGQQGSHYRINVYNSSGTLLN